MTLNKKFFNSSKILLISILIIILIRFLKQNFDIIPILGHMQISYSLYFLLIVYTIILFFNCISLHFNKSITRTTICFLQIIFIGISFIHFYLDTPKYFHFKSPNNKYVLIIEEKSFLLGGWSNFYSQKKNSILAKDLHEEIYTEDGYRPFSNLDYKLNWKNEKTVEIVYNFGNGGLHTVTIKLE